MNTLATASGWRFRFSLWSLFAGVAVCALAMTALKLASRGWSVATISLTIALFLWAALRSIYGPRDNRPFWVGFLIAGGGYAGLLFVLSWCQSWTMNSGYAARNLVNELVTTESLDYLFRKMNPDVSAAFPLGSENLTVFDVGVGGWYSYPAAYAVPNATPPTVITSPSGTPYYTPVAAPQTSAWAELSTPPTETPKDKNSPESTAEKSDETTPLTLAPVPAVVGTATAPHAQQLLCGSTGPSQSRQVCGYANLGAASAIFPADRALLVRIVVRLGGRVIGLCDGESATEQCDGNVVVQQQRKKPRGRHLSTARFVFSNHDEIRSDVAIGRLVGAAIIPAVVNRRLIATHHAPITNNQYSTTNNHPRTYPK